MRQPRVLRGQDVHRGRGDPGHPRGHGEVSDAPRAAQAGGHPERGRHLVMAAERRARAEAGGPRARRTRHAEERDDVESRLGSDPAAAAEAARLQEAAAWLGSLAAATPAVDLRHRVLDAAQERRAAGVGVDPDPTAAIDPVDIFRRGITASIAEIEALSPSDWSAPLLKREWNVREMVGHLLGAARYLDGALGRDEAIRDLPLAEHVAFTQPWIDAERTSSPSDSTRAFAEAFTALAEHAQALDSRSAHDDDAVLRLRGAAIDRARRRELRALGPRRRHPPCRRARAARAVRRRAVAHVPAGRRHPPVHDGLRRHPTSRPHGSACPDRRRRRHLRGLDRPRHAAARPGRCPRRGRRPRASAGSRGVTSTWTSSTSTSRATRRSLATCSPARGCSRADVPVGCAHAHRDLHG